MMSGWSYWKEYAFNPYSTKVDGGQVKPKPSLLYNGTVYTNEWEMDEAKRLDRWIEAGTVVRWEYQVPIPLTIAGRPVLTRTGRQMKYILDFRVYFVDGTEEWREVKGRLSGHAFALWWMKWQVVKNMGHTVVLIGRDGQPVEWAE